MFNKFKKDRQPDLYFGRTRAKHLAPHRTKRPQSTSGAFLTVEPGALFRLGLSRLWYGSMDKWGGLPMGHLGPGREIEHPSAIAQALIAPQQPRGEDRSAPEQARHAPALDWLLNTYYPTLDGAVGTAHDYISTTINWAFTVVSALVVFVLTRDSFPDSSTWIILSASTILISHFAVRTAKGYLNTIRFSTLQRESLNIVIHPVNDKNDDRFVGLMEAVEKYHLEWYSPIPFKTVLYKVMFELSYIYMYLAIFAILAFVSMNVELSRKEYIFAVITSLISIFEYILYYRSPYMRKVFVHDQANKLR